MPEMRSELMEHLAKHLKSELGVHRQLLQIAEHKRDTIVSGDIQEFSTLIQREQNVFEEGQKLRQVREKLMFHIAGELSVEVNALHISHILEMAPDSLRGELQHIQGDLKTLLEKLRELNERNMVLIRQSLSFVKEIMQYVVGSNESKVYQQNGESGTDDSGGKIFNAKC